jgi:glucose/arabinose dehydrogenase
MNSTRYLLLLGTFCSLWGVPPCFADEPPSQSTTLPPPYQTRSVTNPGQVVPAPKGATLKLPPGFHIEEYVADFQTPRFMLRDSQDNVLVSDMQAGKVYVLNKQQRHELLQGLQSPYGLAFYKDWLYVADINAVRRYAYDAGNLKVTGAGQEILSLSRFASGHSTRTLLFDANHEKFYLSIGSASNVDTGEDPLRAAISRFNPDGSALEIYASGLRNAVGIHWYPGSNQLWASTQERDGLGDDLPPDFLTRVQQGGFYGWPYAYIGPHEDPRHSGVAPAMVAKTLYPDVLLGGHAGAMDFVFYTGKQFPPDYHGGCFVALHGSWNRAQLAGYKVVFVPFKDGKPSGPLSDFVSGWIVDSSSAKVWGRPLGLLELPDGSLLLSDDGAGKIWRVSYEQPAANEPTR